MKICIDAGHNYSGYNTGACGNGLKEQEVTWAIAELLRLKLIKLKDVSVFMTRPLVTFNLGIDNSTAVSERYRIANDNNCDLFISIHCNAGGGAGTETLVYSERSFSAQLAAMVQKKIVDKLKLRDRGVKVRKDLAVLKHTRMPAILIETAFIDNAADAQKLADRQADFAEAIYEAVTEYAKLETAKEKAERIIKEKCDSPGRWLQMCDTVPWFAEFVCKINSK